MNCLILKFDIRLMAVVVVLVGLVALWLIFMRSLWYGGKRRNSREGIALRSFLAYRYCACYPFPIIATLIQLAVSKREFLADASGALLTTISGGLAAALEK